MTKAPREASFQQPRSAALAAHGGDEKRLVYELTENIPVGTYVMEVLPDGTPHFTFLSQRWLEMIQLTREEVQANPFNAFSVVHPEEYDAFVALNLKVFAEKLPFFWEGRVIIKGEVRWFSAESIPRDRPDGVTVWEGVMIDITRQKVAEQTLARAHQQMQLAATTAGFGFWEYDFTTRQQVWDDGMRLIYGITRDSFSGVWEDYVHPDDLEAQKAKSREVRRSGNHLDQEYRICRPGGEIRYVKSVAAVIRDDTGQPVRLSGVTRDITERKTAEEQLRASEARLLKILSNSPHPIAIVRLGGTDEILFFNERSARTFGYTLEDVPTVGIWAEKAYPDPVYRTFVFDLWNAAVARAAREKGRVESMEFKVTCKDGTVRDTVFSATVFDDTLVAAMIDITGRKRTEEQLRASEARLDRILCHVPVPISCTTMGPDARVLFLNEPFVNTFGYTLEDIPTVERWQSLACPDGPPEGPLFPGGGAALDNALRHDGRFSSSEHQIRCRDGSLRHVVCDAIILEETLVSVLTDITDRKKAEADLLAIREWEKTREEKQRITLQHKLRSSLTAAAVAHEINQPLSSILMNVRMAQHLQRVGHLDSSVLEGCIATTAAEAERVVSTIERMRSLLRNVETELVQVNLNEVINSALMYVKHPLHDRGIQLQRRGGLRPCIVRGDEAQLKVAVTNLIRNAMEAIAQKDGGSRIIRLELIRRTKTIELVTGDSGCGLPESGLDELPFTTTKPDGSGIGLYLVRTTMENHHGHLKAGRSPLGGAEFRLVFPA